MQQTTRLLQRTLGGVAALIVAFALLGLYRYLSHQAPVIAVKPNNTYEKTLVVAADFDFEPYSFFSADGTPTGHDVELLALIANELHMNLDIRLMKWSDARAAALSGEAHVLPGLEMGAAGMDSIILSIPVVDDPLVVFSRESITSIGQLYNERLATLDGGGGHNKFVRPHRLDGITTLYPTYYEAFKSVTEGTNTAAIARYSVGRRMLAKISGTNLQATGPRLLTGFLFLGISSNDTNLALRIDEAILKLKRDGTLDNLQDKWLGEYVQVISVGDYLKKHLPSVLGFTVLLALIGLFVYVRVNRLLLTAVKSQREHLTKALEYQCLLTDAASGAFGIIHEVNLSQNCPAGSALSSYIASLGLPPETSFSDFVTWFAEHRVHPDYRELFCTALSRDNLLKDFQAGKYNLQCDLMIRYDNNDDYSWIRLTARMFFWRMDNSIQMITCRQNIDEEKRRERVLLDKAQRDPMTGLYNKSAVRQIIEAELARIPECAPGQTPTHGCALFMVDIDNFKKINDSLGHGFGDHVIMTFSAALRRSCRESDVAGRVGGDEFVLFFPGIKDATWAEGQAQRLVHALNCQCDKDERSYTTTASIGVAVCFEAGMDYDTLYANADSALYTAKLRGKNCYAVYKAV